MDHLRTEPESLSLGKAETAAVRRSFRNRSITSSGKTVAVPFAPLLWNSFGTIAALLQEVVSIYPVLSPPNLTPAQSNRVCNALALLQCVASHQDTRMMFLSARMPLYLYPFLNTSSKSRPFEYLRLTSLGVIGALVKVDDTEVISFLLSTEIIPLCLRTMEMGSEVSKTVATFIVQKILLDDVGLDYICTTAERFFAVGRVLGNMVVALAEQPSSRLLKHIIRCYLRLSNNSRACDALRSCLPAMLRDATFVGCLQEDLTTRKWLQQLIMTVGPHRHPAALHGGGGLRDLIGNCRISALTKEKLRKVIEWVKTTRSIPHNFGSRCCQTNVLPRNWKVLEERMHKECLSLSEVVCLNSSCRALFQASISEIFLPPAHNVASENEYERMFISWRLNNSEYNCLADDVIGIGCQSCGSPLDTKSNGQNYVPLYCEKSASRLHVVGLIYRTFMVWVWF